MSASEEKQRHFAARYREFWKPVVGIPVAQPTCNSNIPKEDQKCGVKYT